MSQIYLALETGSYDGGWSLKKYNSPAEALQAVKDGETYGNEWMILRELDIKVEEDTQ